MYTETPKGFTDKTTELIRLSLLASLESKKINTKYYLQLTQYLMVKD